MAYKKILLEGDISFGNSGQSIIPFSSWLIEDKVSIVGQPGIISSSKVVVNIFADNDEVYIQDWNPPIVRNIVPGIGFDIILRPEVGTFSGNVKVNWSWS